MNPPRVGKERLLSVSTGQRGFSRPANAEPTKASRVLSFQETIFGPDLSTELPRPTHWDMAKSSGFRAAIQTVISASKGASKNLKLLIGSEPDVTIVAEGRFNEVPSMIATYDPDLLVLDLRSARFENLGIEQNDPDKKRPSVLIVAADYCDVVEAFQLRAADFVLEPFDDNRIHLALTRVRSDLLQAQYIRFGHQVTDLLRQGQEPQRSDRLVFRDGGRFVFLDWKEIDWIEAAANYVRINAGSGSYLMRENIGRLSRRIDPQSFIRIHRSVVVNVRRIKEVQPVNSGEYIVTLKNGKKLSGSRGFRNELYNFISKRR